jgi:Ca2+-transporting ATPase
VAIFARTLPAQKYLIVRGLKELGEVVAMTGDGINDAPALRAADIGVAMGQRGTEVAREAATMVLLDDNFATIVRAVRNGRRIFDNLRTAFSYLVAFHVPLLLSALVVPLMGAPLLLMPVHLIWLELVVHPTASLVFEADAGARDLMRRRPRSVREAFLSKAGLARPLAEGVILSAIVVALYLGRLASGAGEIEARSLGLATLILGQIGLVLAERSPDQPVWRKGVAGNRMLAWVVAGTLASLFVALYVPPVAAMLHLGTLTLRDWGVAAAAGLAGSLWFEPVKALRRRGADEGR